jgi:hypothetical protein
LEEFLRNALLSTSQERIFEKRKMQPRSQVEREEFGGRRDSVCG